jgi:hypothetical protein
MKTCRLALFFLFIPFTMLGQTLTGLWTGTVSNDSNTVRKDQSFEIVLTQYKDKVYGYSRNEFIVNDTLYYIVKRVKGTIEGDICEVKDDDIISYNFRGRLDKGVKVITTFRLDHQDSMWKMSGEWHTNKTKKFYSVSGKADLKEEKDLAKSRLFPHLEELKLADDVEVYKENKKKESLTATTPRSEEKARTSSQPSNTNATIAKSKPTTVQPEPGSGKTDASIVATTNPARETANIKNDKVNTPTQQVTAQGPNLNSSSRENTGTLVQNNSSNGDNRKEASRKEREEPKNRQVESVASNPVTDTKKPVEETVGKTEKSRPQAGLLETENASTKRVEPIVLAAAAVKERKNQAQQVVNFKSDSLQLALYDNGEVDGDTVSVLLNGEIILAKQGLKASAIKKTVYLQGDSATMILYAENLGKYPPNTGLLIVQDGTESYQVRFSADLQQNAAVIFKRKRQ